jgi:hypothetical protein
MHDVYKKPPFFDVEMHKVLMSPFSPASVDDYYKKIFPKLIQNPNNEYRYNFTQEDYYVYLVCHAAKHYYQSGGTGIRTLVDFYLYNAQKKAELDREYITGECEKLGLRDFEAAALKLANTIFSCSDYTLNETQEFMLNFILDAGTYGVYDNIIKGKINYLNSQKNAKTNSKIRYLTFRIFPDLRYMRTYYTILNPHPYLLPIVWVYRLFLKTFTNSKNAIKEVKKLMKI